MEVKDAREAYYEASRTVSGIIRALGFFGLGIVITFRTAATGQVPSDLKRAAVWVLVSFGLDALHYLVQTATWGIFALVKEKGKKTNFEAPGPMNYAPLLLFGCKVVAMGIAFYYVLVFLFGV